MTWRLITIAPSHFCEKARWGLERLALPYREERHFPILHWRHTLGAGGGRTTPVLVADDTVLRDSTDILLFLDGKADAQHKLYPAEAPLRQQALELEDYFDEQLGPHTRRYAYSFLLHDPSLTMEFLGAGTPTRERLAFRALYPFFSRLMRRGMNITPESAQRSRDKIEAVLNRVEDLLRDGRRFLVGDRFSAADLTFGALAAPLFLPVEYGVAFPSRTRFPASLNAEFDALAKRPAVIFGQRLFREERHRV